MAHTKSQKATRGNRESNAKRLGVKIYGGQPASVGNVIIRQRGSAVRAGAGAKIGRDDTIFAMADGLVKFSKKRGKRYVSVETTA